MNNCEDGQCGTGVYCEDCTNSPKCGFNGKCDKGIVIMDTQESTDEKVYQQQLGRNWNTLAEKDALADAVKHTPTALESQIGGSHYKTRGMQPFEITFANFGYQGVRTAIYTKVNKYLVREKGGMEGHRESIEKSIHCLQVQLELLDREFNHANES